MADEENVVTDDTATDESPLSQTSEDLLRQILSQQAEHRAEVAELRKQLAAAHAAPPRRESSVALSAEELHGQRMEQINAHSHYCPGCGALYNRERECRGTGEAPHPPIEVVSTDELKGDDPDKHTAAPGVNP